MARFGADGFAFYLYILCEIYRDKGYYLQVDDDFNFTASSNLNMSNDKIGQMLNFFIGRSLFSDILFSTDKVLSSPGLQRRFQEAVKTRALKNPVAVNEKFWLLNESETQSFIKVTHLQGISENNSLYSENNLLNSENNTTKESKVNKSKVNESKEEERIPYAERVRLTKEEYELLGKEYREDRDALIKTLNEWKIEKNRNCDNDFKALTSWVPDRLRKQTPKTDEGPVRKQRYKSTVDFDTDAAAAASWAIIENTLKERN
jgi:hypothetical protein